ncbi:MAG: YggT family protein [Deltaproteobacteria bacterium]|jgi:YggT family protein|nr:YggT family protein [Deltaproteobacteria bacterium]MBT4264861.1 YggT family protein [Deltaproteobacteria bacterium]MBT4640053.1 YggT family protein [Deltaproteobacteria bacterium]MBT6612589.1 YggT family protein [Deltaproteobacteria bacterium]MBT7153174.1 YggT family protein [Deltaproteobacteria bacterium]
MNDPVYTIINLIDGVLTFLTYAIIIRAVLSWIRPNPNNPLVLLLRRITDPILGPLERNVPPIAGMDFTPVIAIVLIQVVQGLIPRLVGAM